MIKNAERIDFDQNHQLADPEFVGEAVCFLLKGPATVAALVSSAKIKAFGTNASTIKTSMFVGHYSIAFEAKRIGTTLRSGFNIP